MKASGHQTEKKELNTRDGSWKKGMRSVRQRTDEMNRKKVLNIIYRQGRDKRTKMPYACGIKYIHTEARGKAISPRRKRREDENQKEKKKGE